MAEGGTGTRSSRFRGLASLRGHLDTPIHHKQRKTLSRWRRTLAVPRAGDSDFSFLAPPNSPPSSPPPSFFSLGSRLTDCEPRDTRCEPRAAGAAAGLRPATSTTVYVTSANVTFSPLDRVARPTCHTPKTNVNQRESLLRGYSATQSYIQPHSACWNVVSTSSHKA